jgi:hypothetical protein
MASIFPDLGKPDLKEHIVIKGAINRDIRDVLEKQIPLAVIEAAPLAKHFKGATPLDTARNIWVYLQDPPRGRITYKKDTEDNQDIRMPRRFHHDKTGDCKSYSLNALAIYKAIYPNYPIAPKYTAYEPGKKIPSHVYAVVQDGKGEEIIIDGCYNFFNREKDYTFSLPLKYDMNVRVLSGIDVPNNFHDLYDRLPREQQFQLKNVMAAALELDATKKRYAAGHIGAAGVLAGIEKVEQCLAAAKKAKAVHKHKAGQNALHWLDIAVMAIGRGAYDALVAINLNGMADKLLILKNKHPDQWKKISTLYYELGGYEKALLKAANIGAKHRPIFLSKKAKDRYWAKFGADSRSLGLKDPKGINDDVLNGFEGVEVAGIGILPVVAAAAAAAPVMGAILAAVGKAFHSAGDTKNADELQAQTQEHIDMSQPGQPLDPNNIANVPGVVPSTMPPGSVGANLPAMPPEQAAITAPDPDNGVEPGGILESLFGSTPAHGVGDIWSDLGGAVGGLFHLGMKKLKDKLDNNAKANPVLKQLGNAGLDAASMLTGAGIKALGGTVTDYTTKLLPHTEDTKFHAPGLDPLKVGLGAAALLALAMAFNNNKK